jgi:hypothetical protein
MAITGRTCAQANPKMAHLNTKYEKAVAKED